MNNEIILDKMKLKIDTNQIYYYILVSNPFYGIQWQYIYTDFEHLSELKFISILLEPYSSVLNFINRKVEYAFNYGLFGCDFFKEKRLHTAIPEFLFDELDSQRLSNIDYLTSIIFLNHKKFLALDSNKIGFNTIPKKTIKSILFKNQYQLRA